MGLLYWENILGYRKNYGERMNKLKTVSIKDYSNDDPESYYEGFIRINDGTIFVSYEIDGEEISWKGIEIGAGHFKLLKSGCENSKASLHRFENSNILEGHFFDDTESGMWRFHVEEADDL